MQEMILVCDAYRKDLQHPNEFIRGSTLRFLCKLKVKGVAQPGKFTTKNTQYHFFKNFAILQENVKNAAHVSNFKVTLWHMLPLKSSTFLHWQHWQHSSIPLNRSPSSWSR